MESVPSGDITIQPWIMHAQGISSKTWNPCGKRPNFFDGRNNKRGLDLQLKQAEGLLWVDKKCGQGHLINGSNNYVGKARQDDTHGIFEQLQDYSVLLASIKACCRQKDLGTGRKIHADILERGLLDNNIYVGTALLNMYAKCGELVKAQEVFDRLPARDAICWNGLILGYILQGLDDAALKCFRRMRDECVYPNAVTFSCILKACASTRVVEIGEEIHAEISQQGLLAKDVVLGNALIDMYMKCGLLVKAQEVFDELPVRDVVSWSSLITSYVQHGLDNESLKCFEHMQDEGLSPNAVTLASVLKACGNSGAIDQGEKVSKEGRRLGLLGKNIVLGNALVDMYAKCDLLAKAQEVFDELPVHDRVTWNVLISAYAQHGLYEKAMKCFHQMQDEQLCPNVVTYNALIAGYVQNGLGYEALKCFTLMHSDSVSPDAVTFTCILNACGNLGIVKLGEEIHLDVCKQGLLGKHTMLSNALVDMYGKCGLLMRAREVLDELPIRDVVTWSGLIGAFSQHGLDDLALKCYEQMQDEGVSPNSVTFACVLETCGNLEVIERGEVIHAEVSKLGLLMKDPGLGTALVNMYAKCGALAKAQDVFDDLPTRDVIMWNTLIDGYAQCGLLNAALRCFLQMQDEGFSPNAITFVSLLEVCGNMRAVKQGQNIHVEVNKKGLLDTDMILGTALLDMYAKCGALTEAREVFDKLLVQDDASWNALISGYAEHGLGDRAMECFVQMRAKGVGPNAVTFASIFKACGDIGAVEIGKDVHAEVNRQGLLGRYIALDNALVDMYVHCGCLVKALEAFDELPMRDVVAWSALIFGYAQHGLGHEALKCFKWMQNEGVSPDTVTFAVLLTACSRANLVEEGQMYYNNMAVVYLITPTLLHNTCMVDLFGRAGHFDMAVSVIKMVPPSDCFELWMALLCACQSWANVRLGKQAFEQLVQLNETHGASYICMRNLYEKAGMHEEAERIEALRLKNKAWKLPGCCWWADLDSNVHIFIVGDRSHPQSTLIYAKLEAIHQNLRLKNGSTVAESKSLLCGAQS